MHSIISNFINTPTPVTSPETKEADPSAQLLGNGYNQQLNNINETLPTTPPTKSKSNVPLTLKTIHNDHTQHKLLTKALLYITRTFINSRRPRHPVNAVPSTRSADGKTLLVQTSDNIVDIMELLTTENILGAPVIDPLDSDRCVGILDISDISYFLFSHFSSIEATPQPITSTMNDAQNINSTTGDDFDESALFDILLKSTIKDVLRFRAGTTSKHNINDSTPPTLRAVIPSNQNVLFAMQLLTNQDIRRIAGVNHHQQVTEFYSRSMAVSDITNLSMDLGLTSFLSLPVQDCLNCLALQHRKLEKKALGILSQDPDSQSQHVCDPSTHDFYDVDTPPTTTTTSSSSSSSSSVVSPLPPSAPHHNALIHTILISEPTYRAFELMLAHNVQAVALINSANELCGVLSQRDLRGLGKRFQYLNRLRWTITDFKKQCLLEFPNITTQHHWASQMLIPTGCRFVLNTGTMKEVLLALSDGNLGRVMICSINNSPSSKDINGEEPLCVDGKNVNICGVISLRDVISIFLMALGVSPH